MSFFKEELSRIKSFVFDVDGVFSSNVVLYVDGELMRSINTKDGYAVQYAIKKGYKIAIITGGNSKSVKIRFNNLGVSDVYLASHNKMEDFKDFYFKYDLKPEEILYMGDDLPDFEVMTKVGLPTCPADAVHEIKGISKYISDKKGGQGAVRDVIEQVLRAQGKWIDTSAFGW